MTQGAIFVSPTQKVGELSGHQIPAQTGHRSISRHPFFALSSEDAMRWLKSAIDTVLRAGFDELERAYSMLLSLMKSAAGKPRTRYDRG